MSSDDVVLRIVENETPTAISSVDYLPFGVKILKLQIQRNQRKPDLGPIWIRPLNYQQPDVDAPAAEADKWRTYGTADDDPDLWVAWGAGDESGSPVKTKEKFPADKEVLPLDDDRLYYAYLHLIHRPADPMGHVPQDRQLTVQAVGADGAVKGEIVVTLTAPASGAAALRSQWEWRVETDGESVIRLRASDGDPVIPDYVSRWWPDQAVRYHPITPGETQLVESLAIRYRRQANGDKGEMTVLAGDRQLARIDGDLALPLHDYRLVSAELFRFTDDFHLVLRLWFYWVNLRFTEEELLAFVPADRQAAWRPEAQRIQAELAAGRLPYHKNDEIPDLERFDLLINPQTTAVTHVGTDTHWQEFWSQVQGETLEASLASFKHILRVVLQNKLVPKIESPILNPLSNGLCPIINDGTTHPCPNRPAGKVVTARDALDSVVYDPCPSCQTRFLGEPERAVGVIGKHAPVLKNAKVIRNAVSNNVLNG